MPAPGAWEVSTRRYPFERLLPASVRPRSPASCLSGCIAIRLPPASTQSLNIVVCAAVIVMSPRMATLYGSRRVGVRPEMSRVANSLKPSVRRISA